MLSLPTNKYKPATNPMTAPCRMADKSTVPQAGMTCYGWVDGPAWLFRNGSLPNLALLFPLHFTTHPPLHSTSFSHPRTDPGMQSEGSL